MPYKIEIIADPELGLWKEVDSAFTLRKACKVASDIWWRIGYLDEDEIRIKLDGKVLV